MKKLLISLALAAAAIAPAHAQTATPESTAAARELLDAMNIRQTMSVMAAGMARTMPEMMKAMASQTLDKQPGMTPEKKAAELAKMQATMPRFANTMTTLFNDRELVDAIVEASADSYARHFTVDELRQIAAFYKSPAGAKMLAQAPVLAQEGMQASQRVLLPRIAKLTEQIMAEAAKK